MTDDILAPTTEPAQTKNGLCYNSHSGMWLTPYAGNQ